MLACLGGFLHTPGRALAQEGVQAGEWKCTYCHHPMSGSGASGCPQASSHGSPTPSPSGGGGELSPFALEILSCGVLGGIGLAMGLGSGFMWLIKRLSGDTEQSVFEYLDLSSVQDRGFVLLPMGMAIGGALMFAFYYPAVVAKGTAAYVSMDGFKVDGAARSERVSEATSEASVLHAASEAERARLSAGGSATASSPEERRATEARAAQERRHRIAFGLAGDQLVAAAHHGREAVATAPVTEFLGPEALVTDRERAKVTAGLVFEEGRFVGSIDPVFVTSWPRPKDPVVPPERRTPAIARLEAQRDVIRRSRVALEAKLQAPADVATPPVDGSAVPPPATPPPSPIERAAVKEQISALENQENFVNFTIGTFMDEPVAPAAAGP